MKPEPTMTPEEEARWVELAARGELPFETIEDPRCHAWFEAGCPICQKRSRDLEHERTIRRQQSVVEAIREAEATGNVVDFGVAP